MANKKIEVDDTQDFIHVMNNVISAYKETTRNICEEDNISSKNQERIEKEIDSVNNNIYIYNYYLGIIYLLLLISKF